MPSLQTIATVGFLLAPEFPLMAYASAVEPMRAANILSGRVLYRWWAATPSDGPATASNGAAVLPDAAMDADRAPPDLVLVCAGGNPMTFSDRASFAWLRRLARHGVMMGGISGGPVILAKAGLLAGRRATVHWEHMPAFAEAFPDVDLTRSLFEIDGNRITCSGGIAALDMMVALIARDHGRDLAMAVSEWFLHTQIREGVGPQRMDPRFRHNVTDKRVLEALRLMEENIEAPLSRESIANEVGLSLRQLERAFNAQVGAGMHRHYLALRLGRARQLLRESSMPILDVGIATGFAATSQFSRAFKKAFDASPRNMRNNRRPK